MSRPDLVAANEPTFFPPVFKDDAFMTWAYRVSLRMLNLPRGADECAMQRVIVSAGAYGTDWTDAFKFLMELSRLKKPGPPESMPMNSAGD